MKGYFLIAALAVSLAMCGCNIYDAEQATKRGIKAHKTANQARKHGDTATANAYYRQAKQEFQLAVEKDPNCTDWHYNLARVCQDLGEYEQAANEYELAIQKFPGNAEAHYGKVYCLVQNQASQAQINQAISTAVRDVKIDAGRVYLSQAMAYYHTGRTRDMPEPLEKAGQGSPADAYVQAMVGRFYQALGNTPLAIRHLTIAYELNPEQPGVAYDLGQLGQKLPPR